MKKVLLPFLLLAAILLSASACSFSDPYADGIPVDDPTTSGESETPQTPSNPSDLLGNWHFTEKATVYRFFADGTMQVYYLAPGYFEYEEIVNGTYTYDGITLAFTLEDTTTFSGACSVTNGTVSLSYSSQTWSLTPLQTLPSEHPVYDFPNYKELSATLTLPEGTFTGITVEAEKQYQSATASVVNQISKKQLTPTLKTEGTAKTGDIVNIDYTGKLDGVAFAGGAAEGAVLHLGSGTFIPGFEEQVANRTVSDEAFDINVTFPADYHATELAGMAVVFTIKLNGIYDATEEINKAYQELLKQEIYTLIPGLSELETPLESYQCILQYALDYYHYYAFYYGYDYATFLSLYGISEEEFVKSSQADARAYLLAFLLADHYEAAPDEEFLNSFKADYIKELTASETTEAEAEEYITGDGKNVYEAELMLAFTADYLIRNNTFTPELNQ